MRRLHGTIPRLATTALWLAVAAAAPSLAGEGDAARAEALWKEGAVLRLEKRYDAAIERFNRSLALHPTARTHTYLAWTLSELNRYRDAVAQARLAIELDPEYPNPYNDLGSYLIELKQPGKALFWLEKVITMDDYCCPHYAYYQMGRARLMQGRVDAAREALRIAINIRPRYRAAHELLQRIRDDGLQGS